MSVITRKHFRLLLIISLLCWTFGIIADVTQPLPEPLASYVKSHKSTGDDLVSIAGMLAFVGMLVSYVGLFLIRKWGRTLFIATMAIIVLLDSFEQALVVTASVDVLNSILFILFGAIVTLSLSTSVFDATDTLGWQEALADWKSLTGRVMTRYKGIQQMFTRRNSKLSIISFTSALIILVTGLFLLFATGVTLRHTGDKFPDTLNLIWGVYFIVSIVISFVGIALGVISLLKENSKTLAIIGACLNGFTFMFLGLLCSGSFS
jgi:uncharacterized membrane protein